MPGLENLQTGGYQQQMPDAAKYAMAPLNALWAGREQGNLEQQQGMQLQNNQASLLQNQLSGNVAQAQNNPEGLATLAGGQQGLAQVNAAAGATAQATQPSDAAATIASNIGKKKQSDMQSALSDIQKAIVTLASGGAGPATLATLPEEVRKVATLGKDDPLTNLQNHASMLVKTLTAYSPEVQGKIAVQAPELASKERNVAAVVTGKEAVADKYSAAKIEAAKIRAEFSSAKNGKDLDSVYMTNTAKLSNTHSVEVAKAQSMSMIDPEAGKVALDLANKNYADGQALIDEQYKNHQARISKTPTAPQTNVTLTPEEGFNPTEDQIASIKAATDQIKRTPQFRAQIIGKLTANGIKVK